MHFPDPGLYFCRYRPLRISINRMSLCLSSDLVPFFFFGWLICFEGFALILVEALHCKAIQK